MKYLLLAVLCGNLNTTPSTYTFNGRIEGLSTGWVYLLHEQTEKNDQDSAQVKDGHFTFTGKIDGPEFCLLGVKNKDGRKQFRTGFFLDKGNITITGKKDSIQNAVITGSPAQDEYIQYQKSQKAIEATQHTLEILWDSADNSKNNVLLDSVKAAYKEVEHQQQLAIKSYAAAHPDSYVAAYEIYANFSYNPDADILQGIYGSLSPTLQSSFFGKKINETLKAALLTGIGRPAPEFTQNDVSGKPLALASLKGKYVLVDFWASWCGPCRAENPAVVKAYLKYKDKGFTVLGVSLDDSKDKWIQAIAKDKLEWAQVSDLKGWQNSAADLYGVKGIPMNFLLDKDGKIVAKGLRGEDLENKLAEVLQ